MWEKNFITFIWKFSEFFLVLFIYILKIHLNKFLKLNSKNYQKLLLAQFIYLNITLLFSEVGDIELFITLVPKVFNNVFLFIGLTTLGTFNLLVYLVECFNFCDFVDHHWGCTSLYRLLYYPFRSLGGHANFGL